MEETPVTPKPQGNGLLVGLLAVIVILVGVVVYMALSSGTEMPEDTSTEREEMVTEMEEEDTEEDTDIGEEETAETEDQTDETDEDAETADIDSDLQDLDELDLGSIEDEYSDSTIEDLD